MGMKKWNLIPLSDMGKEPIDENDMTLMELLHIRGIKILLVPVVTPSYAFEYSICADQYSFTAYLAARYASDYNVMIYADGDAVIIETDGTLQEILYRRLFSTESTRCVGHRFPLVEHHIQETNEEYAAQCVRDLVTNEDKWHYALNNCKVVLGNIAARTDSIRNFNVHLTDTSGPNVPSGVRDC